MDSHIENRVQEWLTLDKNEITRSEIQKLHEQKNWSILGALLQTRMTFGTAGLRAKMGPGYSQMNDLTIIQTTQGLAAYAAEVLPNLNKSGIIVGYDGRHNSKRWALIVANVFINFGCKVYLFSKECPTPLVAFGVRHFKTCLGVMITASHNPKDDNGYKVYWSNGAQIISPHDSGISDSIQNHLLPLDSSWNYHSIQHNQLCLDPLPELLKTYCSLQKERLCFTPIENPQCKQKFVYTAMHGVGWETVKHMVTAFGFQPLVPVPEQVNPNPDFPTVDYPNPEEGQSALNLAIKLADTIGSSVIFANDPDADRLAVAEKQRDGKWKIFTGNELGALLGWWLWINWRLRNPNSPVSKVAMLSSTVSSKILHTMSKREGFYFEETLTGFKWMGNRANQLALDGINTIFAFEEAIGFMCSDNVWDKDGVSALLTAAELTATTYKDGLNLSDRLGQIYAKYGHHISNNGYYFCHEPLKIDAMFQRIRHWTDESQTSIKPDYPPNIGKFKITQIRDLTTGYDTNYPDFKARLPLSKSSHCITFTFENGINLTIRTSGTEPKIKYYSELCADPDSKLSVETLTKQLQEVVDLMISELYQPEKNGFLPRAH